MKAPVRILGINAHHADASACLVVDGRLVAAVEEERFLRVKHWAGFPSLSIEYCLEAAGLTADQIDHVAVNRDPNANLLKKAVYVLANKPMGELVSRRLKNASEIRSLGRLFKAPVHRVEHHRAHLASAFYVSPFERAAVVSVDGFGDFVSTMWGAGRGRQISVKSQVTFPHSLGLFYLAMTQYLGFPNYGDEYKVMGLSAYGEPAEMDAMRKIVKLLPRGRFELALEYFRHHSEGLSMEWDGGEPKIGRAFSDRWAALLGPERKPDEPITQRHKDLAASLQAMYEEAFFHILAQAHRDFPVRALCLAGGCAMNSVANGKLFERTPFRELYVQPAAGDSGGAIGAAFQVWHGLKKERSFVMRHAYWGPEFTDEAFSALLASKADELKAARCDVSSPADETALCERTARAIGEGKVIGWFQGRMEWGPRALGNRSILCDPRRADMKAILNDKIKRRESFRPFAPAVLRERTGEWFETDYDVPFMLQVYIVRAEKRSAVPAVTHVNGSGRLQTVERSQNGLFYDLIAAFDKLTGVPMLLNTSFNENEPIVCRPEEALDCFLRTKMDLLVLGRHVVERRA